MRGGGTGRLGAAARGILAALTPAVATAAAEPVLRPAACPEGVDPGAARCGTVTVPLWHAEPEGTTLDLYVVVVPAVERRAGLPPVVPLPGGPGLPSTDVAAWYLEEGGPPYEDRRHRDVVLLDRRGTGQSSPLHCPELAGRHAIEPLDPPELVRACAERLVGQGLDLTAYGTAEAVADLEAVRIALGAEQLDLWAMSAGTRLAQGYLRTHPERVRSAVLVGAVPVDPLLPLGHAAGAQRSLDLVFESCRADEACAAAYPGLDADWQRLLTRLDEGPVEATHLDDDGETSWSGTIRRGPFGEAFRGLLASTGSQLQVPWVVHSAARGDFGPLLAAVGPPAADDPFAGGLYFSVVCPEATARIPAETIDAEVAGTFLGRHRVDLQLAACAQWPVAEPPPGIFEPVRVDVPVLLLNGGRDHITPPAWAREIAQELPRARVVEMPHGGHLFWDWGPESDAGGCFDELTRQFWDEPDPRGLDTSCAENVEHPPFQLPPYRSRRAPNPNREENGPE